MSATQEDPQAQHKSGAYVMKPGGSEEMARLMIQDQLITKGMGGIFPEWPSGLVQVESMLDLACGPGGWALEAAYTYQDIEVVGVDINPDMIAYATAQAEAQQRSNLHFQVMDIRKPLAFPDASFDLVNARLITAFMRPEQWTVLMQECLRILRPGGILRMTEVEWGCANKPALEKAYALLSLTMSRAGYTFSPGGYSLGVLAVLQRLFRNENFQNIHKMAHVIEYSADTEARDSIHHDLSSAFQTLTSFVTQYNVATEEEWQTLSRQALAEMYQEDFCGLWFLLTVWGRKHG